MSGGCYCRCFPLLLPASGWPGSFLSPSDPDRLTRPPPVALRALIITISFSHPFSRRKSAASLSSSSTWRDRLVTVRSIFNSHCFFLFRNRATRQDQLLPEGGGHQNHLKRLCFFDAYLQLLLPGLFQSRSPLLGWYRRRWDASVVWIVVRTAAGRLLAPCLNCRLQGHAGRALGTARAGAKPGRWGPIVGEVTWIFRPAEVGCTDTVVGREDRRTSSEHRPAGLDRDRRSGT